jgi:hypothetical protein
MQQTLQTPTSLPPTGFLRAKQILGDKKEGLPPIIPVSKSVWWLGVKAGRFPKPVKLSTRTTAWRVEDIRAFIDSGEVKA